MRKTGWVISYKCPKLANRRLYYGGGPRRDDLLIKGAFMYKTKDAADGCAVQLVLSGLEEVSVMHVADEHQHARICTSNSISCLKRILKVLDPVHDKAAIERLKKTLTKLKRKKPKKLTKG